MYACSGTRERRARTALAAKVSAVRMRGTRSHDQPAPPFRFTLDPLVFLSSASRSLGLMPIDVYMCVCVCVCVFVYVSLFPSSLNPLARTYGAHQAYRPERDRFRFPLTCFVCS